MDWQMDSFGTKVECAEFNEKRNQFQNKQTLPAECQCLAGFLFALSYQIISFVCLSSSVNDKMTKRNDFSLFCVH